MKTTVVTGMVVALFVLPFVAPAMARARAEKGADEAEAQLRVSLSLRDGSTLVGTPGLTMVELTTEFGDASVPLGLLSSIQLDAEKKTRLTFRNADQLSGVWEAKVFRLDGLVGRLEIALTNITKIGVTKILPRSAAVSISPDGTWKLGKMEGGPRAWGTATVLKDGTVLVVGGCGTTPDDQLSSCYIFDPVTETFRPTGSLHTRRNLHTATLLNDGRVLVVGGYNSSSQWQADAEIFDPVKGVWTVVPPPSKHGVVHTATLLPDGRVFVFGGAIGSSLYSRQGDLFDPRTDTWTPAQVRTGIRASHAAALLADGSILIAGGDSGSDADNAMVYDPVAGSVRIAGRLPHSQNDAALVEFPGGRRYALVGGSDRETPTGCTIIDIETGNVEQGPMPAGGHVMGACVPDGSGRLLILGGSSRGQTEAPVRSTDLFDAASNSWTALPDMHEARCLVTHSAVRLQDGRIAIFGGSDGKRGLDSYEIYTSPQSMPKRK